jgi:DNA-binding NtrC family response regulator
LRESIVLDGLQILILEDEALLAIDLALTVEDKGGRVIGPLDSVASALATLDARQAGAAILDANLLDRDVTPVALRLIERGVPFVLYTGTGIPAELAAAHAGLPVVMKPAPMTLVVDTLAQEIARRQRTTGRR